MDGAFKKIGLIGLGVMGQRHCEAIAKMEHARLTAVCDQRPEAVEKIKKAYQVERGYTSTEDFLKKEDLDLLIVATHGPSHASITIQAAEAGIPRIFCEKPMTVSLKDAEDMVEVCRQHNVRLAVNHSRRWMSPYVRLKKILKEGTIGEIRHMTFEFAGGQLASNGGHLWDLVRFLTEKEPVRVLGFLDKTGTPNPRGAQYFDPGAYGLLWLENDIKVFFNMGEDYGLPFFMEIMGSIGRVLIEEKSMRWEISARKPEDRHLPMTKRTELVQIPFVGEQVDIVDACRRATIELLEDGPISCDGNDGLKSLMVTLGIHQSEATGNQMIDLPLPRGIYSKEFQFT